MSIPLHVLLFMYSIVHCTLVVFDIHVFYYVCISPILGVQMKKKKKKKKNVTVSVGFNASV